MDYLIETNPYFSNNQKEGNGYSIITLIVYLWVYFTIYWVSTRCLASKIKKNANLKINHNSMVIISVSLVFVGIYFNLMTVFYNDNSTFSLIEGILNIFVCFLALLLQFSQLQVNEVTDELNSFKSLWAERNKQYEMAKKNIEIINIKCHDLKHQIHQIDNAKAINKEELKEIEKAIQIYDLQAKTGNEALDIILTEKGLVCEKNKIELTIIADGNLLSFMEERDIYSLFGNALDNSIEALEKIDEGKRNISLFIKKKLNFVSIHIENNFFGNVVSENNLPKTSKDDTNMHGFGFLSMKEITSRYGGTVTYTTKDNVFSLDFLFQIKEK